MKVIVFARRFAIDREPGIMVCIALDQDVKDGYLAFTLFLKCELYAWMYSV